MTRYIDADKLVAWCKDTYQAQSTTEGKAYVNAFLTQVFSAPTADVVPKSEVDWNSIPVDVSEALKQRAVEKAKTEVAREIFEEIEKILIDSAYIPDCARFVDIDKLAELKKKYTEENV